MVILDDGWSDRLVMVDGSCSSFSSLPSLILGFRPLSVLFCSGAVYENVMICWIPPCGQKRRLRCVYVRRRRPKVERRINRFLVVREGNLVGERETDRDRQLVNAGAYDDTLGEGELREVGWPTQDHWWWSLLHTAGEAQAFGEEK